MELVLWLLAPTGAQPCPQLPKGQLQQLEGAGIYTSQQAERILMDPERLYELWKALSAAEPDIQPDALTCLLAQKLPAAKLADLRYLRDLIENYRHHPDPVFVSAVLSGILHHGVPQAILTALFRDFEREVCSAPPRGPFARQVAADLLAASSQKFREQYIESILERYGPGSAIHYKIEAQDCLFLTDRWLAQVALASLPAPRRKVFEPKLLALFP